VAGTSWRELNRATLARQLLLQREELDVLTAMRHVVALQAQHAASPYIALWNRLSGFDPAELDAAFADRTLVKGTVMRFTLHAVLAGDHPVMHAAMQPSLRTRLQDSRFTVSGLSPGEAHELVRELLVFLDIPRTAAEIEEWIHERVDAPPGSVWWALRSFAPVLHAPTGGPWSFGWRPSFTASGTAPLPEDPVAFDEALQTLAVRYLEGFGPASVADLAQFALVQRSRARAALQSLAGTLERVEGPGGVELFDVPGGRCPAADTPAPPRLLPMWDSVLLAYSDRSRILPPEYRRTVIRSNGDVLPTLLVDGYVAGVWRPVEGGIEARPFSPLRAEDWEGLAAEARSLIAFLADREPEVYRRYARWWAALPDTEVRVLPP
jgi:hypothetical protein